MGGKNQFAREALRARQGGGARYDSENAPHSELLFARRGTAYFARKLNELSDADLLSPSQRDGWSRTQLIVLISHEARELAISLKALREPLIEEEKEWRPDLDLAATLPARALRHLFDHSAKHLDVEWRDLPNTLWDEHIPAPGGNRIVARDIPRLRAVKIWYAAVDLGNGGRRSDIPVELRA